MQPPKEANGGKSIKKRRTTGSIHDRRFKCGCGRAYLSYPALYTHIKNKHNNIHPANTIIPKASQKRPSLESSSEEETWRGQSPAFREMLAFLKYCGYVVAFTPKKAEGIDLEVLMEHVNFLSLPETKALKSHFSSPSKLEETQFFAIAFEMSKFLEKDEFSPLFEFLLFFRREILAFFTTQSKSDPALGFDYTTFAFFSEGQLSSFCNFFFTKKVPLMQACCPGFRLSKGRTVAAEEKCLIIFLKLLSDLMAEQRVVKAKIEINTN